MKKNEKESSLEIIIDRKNDIKTWIGSQFLSDFDNFLQSSLNFEVK